MSPPDLQCRNRPLFVLNRARPLLARAGAKCSLVISGAATVLPLLRAKLAGAKLNLVALLFSAMVEPETDGPVECDISEFSTRLLSVVAHEALSNALPKLIRSSRDVLRTLYGVLELVICMWNMLLVRLWSVVLEVGPILQLTLNPPPMELSMVVSLLVVEAVALLVMLLIDNRNAEVVLLVFGRHASRTTRPIPPEGSAMDPPQLPYASLEGPAEKLHLRPSLPVCMKTPFTVENNAVRPSGPRAAWHLTLVWNFPPIPLSVSKSLAEAKAMLPALLVRATLLLLSPAGTSLRPAMEFPVILLLFAAQALLVNALLNDILRHLAGPVVIVMPGNVMNVSVEIVTNVASSCSYECEYFSDVARTTP